VCNYGAGRASLTRLSCRHIRVDINICWHEASLEAHQFEEIYLCTEYVDCNTRPEFSSRPKALSSKPRRSLNHFSISCILGCPATYGVVSSGISNSLGNWISSHWSSTSYPSGLEPFRNAARLGIDQYLFRMMYCRGTHTKMTCNEAERDRLFWASLLER